MAITRARLSACKCLQVSIIAQAADLVERRTVYSFPGLTAPSFPLNLAIRAWTIELD
jgi:hypothetical protein